MNNKLLIGIIVVIVGLVIATAILRNPVWAMTLIEVTLLGVCIYLGWMVWKKKTKIFHDQMEPKLAEKRSKWLEKFLRVAWISFAVFLVSFMLHDVLGDLLEIIGKVALGVSVIAMIGGLVVYLIGRRKTS